MKKKTEAREKRPEEAGNESFYPCNPGSIQMRASIFQFHVLMCCFPIKHSTWCRMQDQLVASSLESQFIVGSRLHILLILIFGGLRRQQNVLFASVACPQGSSGKNMAGMFDVLLVELP
jgi:hypothetical protein